MVQVLQQILFLLVAALSIGLFAWQVRKIRANILQGKDRAMGGSVSERINKTLLVAFGQQKMFKRLTPALLHLVVYVGFLVINIEVIEIMIDGLAGSHRILRVLGPGYDALMATNEVLGALVIVAVAAFWWRRNRQQPVRRLTGVELRAWPKMDANIILYVEVALMLALFTMNSADLKLHQLRGEEMPGTFPVSALLVGLMPDSVTALHVLERVGWWIHIVGILAFLNYLPSSKHFHIIMAFPNVYYSRLVPQGQFSNVDSITHEVKSMMDPSYQVPAPPVDAEGNPVIERFGAKDVEDLAWTNLLNAYSCTECGRCTSVCPANITGKLLSPRKIIMDTRDRMEEKFNSPLIFKPNNYKGEDRMQVSEEGTLVHGKVTAEELWACTTCNACVEACPVNINPLDSIIEMRRYLVLEETAAPNSLNVMFSNIENNGAPWAFSPSDRFNWADDLFVAEKA
ncbi:4Fe-4S dicluster domain-containing protein [Hymenobacter jeollabukensis]|uniref:4Fe-4S dicluster domain-containing protein n=1 Tax=Hymenobacter jeollabukensis TaxID=2025313 RepID=A0A5R8WTS1_9BACT|nr:4Fe-4S dicluster domain-containing protein [Hymenobacter jeollabukensis]TLM95172.1 4Fe-4S dicluster domain-containing protein [Hymenobacter jeollabukensis]